MAHTHCTEPGTGQGQGPGWTQSKTMVPFSCSCPCVVCTVHSVIEKPTVSRYLFRSWSRAV